MTESMRGKTVVITGASAGIGAAAARAAAQAGASVIPIGRSPAKTAAIAEELGADAHVVDFADFASVRRLADDLNSRVDRIDVFVHNAGAMIKNREVTVDGHERTIQTNYLGPFLLQLLIQDHLRASGARVMVTSSVAHHVGVVRPRDLDGAGRRYSMINAYAASKLADLLFVRQLARLGTVAVGFDPGFVATDFILPATGVGASDPETLRAVHRLGLKLLNVVQPDVAAAGILRFAAMDEPERLSGRLISPTRPVRSSPASHSSKLAGSLWTTTEAIVSRG